ncbi:MAG: hypothetical protein DMF61_18005 [Blastocatellia bacterium AA13]|nr:MAG: hypothetical protein DMF61_18005 [Blastocatellia bacterium AA13]
MIDIHSHILPETDDGAHDLDEAVEMGMLSAGDGVTVMVATPHAHDSVHETHTLSSLRTKIDLLNSRLNGRPRIELGCELRFTHDVIKHVCLDKSAPTLAGGPYALIEFPHLIAPVGSERVLFELMSNQITPVIAHPERNRVLIAEPERFFGMVEMGVLGQVDSGSILGQFGKMVQKTARLMIEHGLIHIIASDCHNTRNRLPGLSNAVAATSKLVGDEVAQALVDANPRAVVEGKPIPYRFDPVLPSKKKRWFLFGR